MVTSPLATLMGLFERGGVLILTGAGISTDSGIPDYRGPDGRARNVAPMTFQRFVGSEPERRRYWARSHVGWERFAAARPNAGHLAVAALGRADAVHGVVTQNVDGLHEAAGSVDTIDLHGRLDRVACLGCGARRPRLEVGLRLDAVNPGFRTEVAARPDRLRPDGDLALDDEQIAGFRVVDCRACGGLLKPDVVYFGEQVPRTRVRAAFGLLDSARALVVLGSSLMVGSGYRFATGAARRGIPVAIVTRGVSRADHLATLRVDAPLAEVLPPIAARLGTAPAHPAEPVHPTEVAHAEPAHPAEPVHPTEVAHAEPAHPAEPVHPAEVAPAGSAASPGMDEPRAAAS